MRSVRKGDDAVVHTQRADCPHGFAELVGKTGRVLAVQQGTGDLLLKFKGRAWPVAFPRANCGVRFNGDVS